MRIGAAIHSDIALRLTRKGNGLKRPSIPQLPSLGAEDRVSHEESAMRRQRGLSQSIVTALLALAIVVGQQVCCCSFSSCAAPPAATDTAAQGCCCCEQPTDGASSCPGGSGQNHGKSCPCRGKPRPAAIVASGFVPGLQLDAEYWTGIQGMWLTAWMPSAHHVRTSDTLVRPRSVEDVPVIGGRTLLRALSVLRC